ncbi:hypothetical protein BgiMline_016479 [Biomphalaria glabrata]|nr:hypothetical protein BgiMline_009282 [Biomphalaria glabrata]
MVVRDVPRTVSACMYEKQPWSVCDVETKQKQRDMILIKGNSTQCVPKKTITKACKKTCRYDRSGWSACDKLTRQKQRQLTPKSNSPPQCTPTVETRPCYVRAELTAAKSHKCRYMPGTWSECDPRSNTMTMVMTSKTRDPVCQKYKKLSRKCKAACKFRRGEWSECDETSQLMTRVDSLVSGSPKQCDESRQITKKCRRKCKYTFGEWGECDPVTNHRTRVKKLVDGGDQTKCLPEDIVTKPCEKKNGRERCFYGAWGEFGPCTNGVVTKNRQVLQGGVECERKAVITQACTKTPGS